MLVSGDFSFQPLLFSGDPAYRMVSLIFKVIFFVPQLNLSGNGLTYVYRGVSPR